jgi:hypothetical protein
MTGSSASIRPYGFKQSSDRRNCGGAVTTKLRELRLGAVGFGVAD